MCAPRETSRIFGGRAFVTRLSVSSAQQLAPELTLPRAAAVEVSQRELSLSSNLVLFPRCSRTRLLAQEMGSSRAYCSNSTVTALYLPFGEFLRETELLTTLALYYPPEAGPPRTQATPSTTSAWATSISKLSNIAASTNRVASALAGRHLSSLCSGRNISPKLPKR
ncbi:hypothetical protein QAD02_012386 [Eretmocerus hayati]|uniref:Uncharacterized protein n=1 Tax=Eretmocerus hayati TaxID=131215 RepID=A0ACC2NZC3_9HYME|nr:hypothetical protein QAD02_012386 [Eretmocerus hayati]